MNNFRRPDYEVKNVFTSLSQNKNWGIDMFNIPELWKHTKGAGIKVAILDTGRPNPEHIDLHGSAAVSKNFTTNKGVNFIDKDGHGTHVAGIIAARDNEFGVIGVAPECTLYIAKVLGDNGMGSIDYIIKAIEWAIRMKVDIINMSLGSSTNPGPELHEAIKKAYRNDITIIAAAGNSGKHGQTNTTDWPAKYPEVISVGSIDRDKLRSKFSSVGDVDILAPGGDIISTFLNNDYAVLSGTSMASPFVTGIAALCLAKHRIHGGATPCKTPAQVKEHLIKSAIDVDAPGWDKDTGFGIINPVSLLEEVPETETEGHFRILNRQVPNIKYTTVRKKTDTIRVAQINSSFTVDTFEGEQNGKPGDFLAVGPLGEVFVITKSQYEKEYERV